MKHKLTLPQALFLLARNSSTGKPIGNYNKYVQPAGAVTELIMMDRLVLRTGKRSIVEVKDASPTGSNYLDAILSRIAESSRPRRLQHWVSRLGHNRERIDMIGEELVAKRIIEKVPAKYLGIFPVTRWRPRRTGVRAVLLDDMSKILFEEASDPDEWTGSVIALANSGHLLKRNFSRAQLRAHRDHIKRVTKGEWPSADAAAKAVKAIQAAIATAAAIGAG